MASHAPLPFRARALATAILAAAGLFAAAPSCIAAVARTAAEAAPPSQADDASYENLVRAAKAVVGVKVHALPDARSNGLLGQDRDGSGVVIAGGLVLTVSYLVQEADKVQVTDSLGQTIPAAVVAADDATGFGLLRPLGGLALEPIRIGSSAPVARLDRLLVVSGGESQAMSIATVVSRRPFAGYWEYLLDDAIFTTPPRLDHSGAALINKDGELVGIGSLFVMDSLKSAEKIPGNMFVPIDLLGPALDQMIHGGEEQASHRPWLGVDSIEEDGRVKVMQVSDEGPAAKAGIKAGDIILSIDGEPVDNLPKFYRRLWGAGPPGTDVRLTVLQGVAVHDVTVHSIDHQQFLRHQPGI